MKRFKYILGLLVMILCIASCVMPGTTTQYKVKLMLDEDTVYETLTVKSGEEVELPTPEKEGYTFEGWYEDEKLVESKTTFTKDTTLIAKFEELEALKYTYKFIVDGEVIKEVEAEVGTEIEYPEDPIKRANEKYVFTFVGWDNDATVLEQNEEFNAIFESELRNYTYKFIANGQTIKRETLPYGSEIVYPEDPEKADTAKYDYTFTGWDHDDTILTGNIIFTAQFSYEIKQYTYKFVNYNGEVLKEETVDYGTMPEAPESPVKPADGDTVYKFVGWDKKVVSVTADVVYTAVFEEDVPVTSLDGLKVSILGDSISTFYKEGSEMNSYYTGTNEFYYPTYSASIKTVDLTWWYKLIKNNNMELGINNSWSGSCASGTITSAGQTDGRINTIDDNGAPDVVIIYLGTNDCASAVSTKEFTAAIETMIKKINALCNTQIFITTLGYAEYNNGKYSDATRVEYNAAIRQLAVQYECGIVPLDEYILDDNYSIYLGDRLHYNAKGANLLSLVYEKSIKEYFGIEFDKEIEVEHLEKLPEGVVAQIEITSNTNFWGGYASNIYLFDAATVPNALYSHKILITLNEENNTYYVTEIYKTGVEVSSYNCDYVLLISDAHNDVMTMKDAVANVKVGDVAEFDSSNGFPFTLQFKEGDGSAPEQPDPKPDPEPDNKIEGQLYVGAYNSGVWTVYGTTVIAYSQEAMDKNSTFINFYIIKITKNASDDNYTVTALKNVDVNCEFSECSYYILIYRDLADKTFYENAKVGQTVVITGDIESGKANLEFK